MSTYGAILGASIGVILLCLVVVVHDVSSFPILNIINFNE